MDNFIYWYAEMTNSEAPSEPQLGSMTCPPGEQYGRSRAWCTGPKEQQSSIDSRA
jgi:hypothetical protein